MFFDPLLQGAAQEQSSGGGPINLVTAFKVKTSLGGVLVNFASVTLVAPLYEGPGGVLNPSFWRGPTPEAGTLLYYDPAHMTVQSNGEVIATSANFSAIIQFNYQGTMQLGDFIVTSGLSASFNSYARLRGPLATRVALTEKFSAKNTLHGAVQTAIAMRTGIRNKKTFRGEPVTQITLRSALRAVTSMVVHVSTPAIQLVARMRAAVTMRGVPKTSVSLTSQFVTRSVLRGNPVTRIALRTPLGARVVMKGSLVGGTVVVYAGPTQISLVDEVFVVDGSDCYISIAFVDTTDKPYTPTSLSYELNDNTNGVTVIPLTPISPIASTMMLTITGAQNTMNANSRLIERRKLLLKVGIPGGSFRYETLPYPILRETGTP